MHEKIAGGFNKQKCLLRNERFLGRNKNITKRICRELILRKLTMILVIQNVKITIKSNNN